MGIIILRVDGEAGTAPFPQNHLCWHNTTYVSVCPQRASGLIIYFDSESSLFYE